MYLICNKSLDSLKTVGYNINKIFYLDYLHFTEISSEIAFKIRDVRQDSPSSFCAKMFCEFWIRQIWDRRDLFELNKSSRFPPKLCFAKKKLLLFQNNKNNEPVL